MRQKVSKTALVYLLLLTPFVKPGYFENINILDALYNGGRFAAFFIIVYLYAKNENKSNFVNIILLLQIATVISTIVMGGSLARVSMYICINLGVCMLIHIWMNENVTGMISTLATFFGWLVIINYILLLLFPNGLYFTYGGMCNFLDIDNQIASPLFVAILSNGLSIIMQKKKNYFNYLIIVLSIATIVRVWAATALVAIIVGGIVLLVNRNRSEAKHFIKARHYFVFIAISFIFIVLLHNMGVISYFIQDYLGKSLTLSGRTYIWTDFIQMLQSKDFNILLGNGVKENYFFYSNTFAQYIHPHNQIFFVLLEGGLVCLMIWLTVNIAVIHRADQYIGYFAIRYVSIVYFMFMVVMIAEVFRVNTYYFIVLTMMYESKLLISKRIPVRIGVRR